MKTYTIKNEYQELTILNYGASIYKWNAFKDNTNIVISNLNLEDYINKNDGFLSATIGRVTNRIDQGKFILNDIEYHLEQNFDGNASSHGGFNGFDKRKFELFEHTKTKLVLKYVSKDLEGGYPGELELFVTYSLNNNEMLLSYDATSNKDTIVNLTNHAYFNLSNDEPNILNHEIEAGITKTLETNQYLVPSGNIINTKGTVLDFTNKKSLNEITFNELVLNKSDGLDHAFLFNENERFVNLSFNNKLLRIETTYPGMQIYTMQNKVNQPLLNRTYEKYIGIALEAQYEPNAINIPSFNSVILRKDDKYHEEIKYILLEK